MTQHLPQHPLVFPIIGGNPALRSLPQRLQDAIVLALDEGDDVKKRATALRTIASFLLSKKTNLRRRLACVEVLFAMDENDKKNERVYILAFVSATPSIETSFIASTLEAHPDLVWDLRAACQELLVEATMDTSILIPNNDTWWNVQRYCCETQREIDRLDDLLDVHQGAPRAGAPVLCSLVFLRSQQGRSHPPQADDEEPPATADSVVEPNAYNHAIQHVAYYFADRAEADAAKLKVMSFLIGNSSEARLSLEFVRQVEHIDTSQFQNERSFLLWELRALCVHQQDLQQQYDGHVLQAANVAAECITDTAEAVTNMLRGTTQIASHGLETASRLVVEHTEPGPGATTDLAPLDTSLTNNDDNEPSPPQQPSPAVAVTGAVHRATDHARTWTAAASRTVRSQAAQHLHAAATRVPVPPQHATTIRAATHVAMACIGATAAVGEALFVETGNVCTSATEAMSSIVEHKCGEEAGQMTRHVGSTVGNVVRTAAHVALFTGGGVPRSVVKSTGKWHMMRSKQAGQATEDTVSTLLDESEDDSCSVVVSVGQSEYNGDQMSKVLEEFDEAAVDENNKTERRT